MNQGETALPIQAVIFDYGGVLRHDARDDFDAIDEAFGLPPGALWAAFHDIPAYRLSRTGSIDGTAFRAAVRATLVRAVGGEQPIDAALAALDNHLAGLPAVAADMRALLDRLRTGGRVRLGLLSNGGRGGTERLRAAGVLDLFDNGFVSGDVGLAKPDPAVFRFAAARLGVEPARCLMIDDQRLNLEGAHMAGLRTHLFERRRLADLLGRLEAEGVLG